MEISQPSLIHTGILIYENWEAMVLDDKCPIAQCGGELDTGYECNECGADCIELGRNGKPIESRRNGAVMARQVSEVLRNAIYRADAGQRVFITLIEISHPDLDEPLRFTSDGQTTTHMGENYTAVSVRARTARRIGRGSELPATGPKRSPRCRARRSVGDIGPGFQDLGGAR